MRLFIFLALLLNLMYNSVQAQTIGVGGSIMYNFQSESFGAGARVSIFPQRRLSFVPQFSYYFPFNFNKVNEYYAGMSFEYKFIHRKKIILYALAHGGYNSWKNYTESVWPKAQKSNWDAEGGIGISGAKCLRPFLEYRYNVNFRETHLQLGLLYIFGCEEKKWGFGWNTGGDNKKKGIFGRRKKGNGCAAFD